MFDNFKQTLKIVFQALLSNKTRSFLTMLGIVIGVAAVILIISLGAGAQSFILNQVDKFGSDLIGILPGNSDEKGAPALMFGIQITSLKDSDAKALLKEIPQLRGASSYYSTNVSTSYQDLGFDGNLDGVNGDYLLIEQASIEEGRFFSEEELRSANALVVLGSGVAQELFPNNSAVGKRIKVNNRQAQVIGVFKSRGQVGLSSTDDSLVAPLAFVQKEIAGVNYLSSIRVRVDDEKNIDEAIENIKLVLRERHNIAHPEDDDFTVRGFKEALDMINTITSTLKYFLAAMAALSLIVGGVGIMNIMLVSIKERTREIGLRQSIGATRRQIRYQFLLEAVTLTVFGGLFGLILGIALAYIVSVVMNYLGYFWAFKVSILSILLAISVSALVGIIFGYYPAKEASKLDPIEALRYE